MSYSVLLIENDPSYCDLISETLYREFPKATKIECYPTYEQAFGVLFYKKWNLILIDRDLPTKNGLDTLKAIQGVASSEGTRIFLYARNNNKSFEEEAVSLGAIATLSRDDLASSKGAQQLLSYL